VRFAAIADWADSDAYPVSFMCTQLGVSRSGYYAWRGAGPCQRSKDDSALIAIMRKVYEEARGNPGVRRMRAGLAALGHLVSQKRVHRLMQAAGLRGRHPRAWKRTTIGGDKPVAAPDLIGRDFTAEHPGTRWCGDVTYIKTWDGWAYLATVIDLYSRKLVGWAIATHMRTSLVTAAPGMAVAARKPPAGVIFIARYLWTSGCRSLSVSAVIGLRARPGSDQQVGDTHRGQGKANVLAGSCSWR
jgi:putative transposase